MNQCIDLIDSLRYTDTLQFIFNTNNSLAREHSFTTILFLRANGFQSSSDDLITFDDFLQYRSKTTKLYHLILSLKSFQSSYIASKTLARMTSQLSIVRFQLLVSLYKLCPKSTLLFSWWFQNQRSEIDRQTLCQISIMSPIREITSSLRFVLSYILS